MCSMVVTKILAGGVATYYPAAIALANGG
jgi:hypothetical protein